MGTQSVIDSLLAKQHQYVYWLIVGAFAVTIALEYTTPSEYVFGYLYTGPILIANARLSRVATLQVTLGAAGLTLFNLFFPTLEPNPSATVANRLIAVMALLVTGWLADRIRRYEEAIARQQEKLRAQEQLASVRQDFVSTLTHDLKTPLLGAIETLKSFQNEQFGAITPMQSKVVAMMIRSHRSTLELVQTVLDIYRNDSEGLKLHTEPVNLVAIAKEVQFTLTNLASTRRVSLCLTYGSSNFSHSLWVEGDSLQLQRVFTNLIANGINHSPRGNKVEVILETSATHHKVLVVDSGLGIPPEDICHLFERFYQGHGDRQATGSGLGLYLSRQIIEAHGGTIWAENRLPQGATFGFKLPACAPVVGSKHLNTIRQTN